MRRSPIDVVESEVKGDMRRGYRASEKRRRAKNSLARKALVKINENRGGHFILHSHDTHSQAAGGCSSGSIGLSPPLWRLWEAWRLALSLSLLSGLLLFSPVWSFLASLFSPVL